MSDKNLVQAAEDLCGAANAVYSTKTGKYLTDLHKCILQGAVLRKSYKELASEGWTEAHLKKEGAKLWKVLSEALDKEVSKNNFQTALQHWRERQALPKVACQHIAPPVPKHQDWGDAPDVSVFFGREAERAELKQWIVDERCRLVGILGIGGVGKTHLCLELTGRHDTIENGFRRGGIGKTDLSVKLAQEIQQDFDYIIWRSLLNAPPFADILGTFLKFLSHQQAQDLPETPKALDEQLGQLLHHLRASRCLLILDNVETILQDGNGTGQYREGYEAYEQLFKKIGEVPHQSCLLLTSRVKLPVLLSLEGKKSPVRSLELKGLDELSSQNLFATIGDFSGSPEEWQKLVQLYGGNPLALEIVAKHIRAVFNGDISLFLNQGSSVFGDLRSLLNWHFSQLSDSEKEITYWLAIRRQATSVLEMQADIIAPVTRARLPETWQSLLQKFILENHKDGQRFTLQPVLMEYITERLVEQVCQELETGKFYLCKNHALMQAQATDIIRKTQIRIIIKPIIERLIHTFHSQENLKNQLDNLLLALRRQGSRQPGYIGGNMLNLLCKMGVDLSDYDFSHLTIRQAYLQGQILHRVC